MTAKLARGLPLCERRQKSRSPPPCACSVRACRAACSCAALAPFARKRAQLLVCSSAQGDGSLRPGSHGRVPLKEGPAAVTRKLPGMLAQLPGMLARCTSRSSCWRVKPRPCSRQPGRRRPGASYSLSLSRCLCAALLCQRPASSLTVGRPHGASSVHSDVPPACRRRSSGGGLSLSHVLTRRSVQCAARDPSAAAAAPSPSQAATTRPPRRSPRPPNKKRGTGPIHGSSAVDLRRRLPEGRWPLRQPAPVL